MKTILGWVFFLSASLANAQQTPTLSSANGVIIKGIGDYATFSLEPGAITNCEVDAYFHKCDLERASATIVSGENSPETIVFTRYLYADRLVSGVDWEEWTYIGTWTRTIDGITVESPARIRIYDSSDRNGIYGYLRLDDFDIQHQLKAMVSR